MVCRTCTQNKDESEFAWKNKAKGVRSTQCRACHSAYTKAHYQNNSETYKLRAAQNNPRYREECKLYILEYLQKNPCVDCGEADLDVLEFDHIEMVGMSGPRVGDYIGSINKLKKEIEKCEVRCANCHTRRTRRQLGWSRIMPL